MEEQGDKIGTATQECTAGALGSLVWARGLLEPLLAVPVGVSSRKERVDSNLSKSCTFRASRILETLSCTITVPSVLYRERSLWLRHVKGPSGGGGRVSSNCSSPGSSCRLPTTHPRPCSGGHLWPLFHSWECSEYWQGCSC